MSSVNDDDPTTDDERRLSAALNAAAAEIVPAPGGLARIRERTSAAVPWWRRQLVLRVAAGAVATSAAVVALVVATRGGPDDDTVVLPADSSAPSGSDTRPTEPTPSAPPSVAPPTESPSTFGTTVAPPPDPSGSAPAPEPMTVPVYYVADTPQGDRLVREFHTISTDRGAVATALGQMLAAPSDPDYRSLWAPTTQVVGAEVADGTIEVELASPSGADGGFASPELAVQQLVYTATAAASSLEGADGALPVQIRVDGSSGELRAVDLSAPITREDQLDVRQLVQITNPAEGSESTSPVTVDGEAAAFEANLVWEVRDADGAVVASDFTTAAECCTFSPFTFEVELAPGSYEIAVSDTDPSGGAEGPGPMTDTKSFTVVP